MPSKKPKRGSLPPEDENHMQQSFLTKVINIFHFILFVCYGLLSTACSALKGYWRIIQPQKKKDISQEIILVTGGGRGLGRRLALEFAKHSPKQGKQTLRLLHRVIPVSWTVVITVVLSLSFHLYVASMYFTSVHFISLNFLCVFVPHLVGGFSVAILPQAF
uniref:Uncharacterized protein n=1 Tax=Octopus bimaculoides TaxID=37653 RepID=A0A0L8HJQ2_OCTBM